MRYVILGAGAIGGTIGGRLAEAGQDVLLLARGAHAEALRRDGLTLAMPDRTLHLQIPVISSVTEWAPQPDDVLILCVKSQDTEGILGELSALRLGELDTGGTGGTGAVGGTGGIGGTGAVGDILPLFCAQNGINNELAATRYFAKVHGICVNLPATHLEPGIIEANGLPVSGILDLGRFPSGSDEADADLATTLQASGFTTTVEQDVMAVKRRKLIDNLGNAAQALFGLDGGSDVEDLVSRAAAEARACFTAAGVSVFADDRWAQRRTGIDSADVGGRPRGGGSTWQSITRGLGSVETDYLNGEIVQLGRLHGVSTPANAALQREMSRLVSGRGEPGAATPAAMLAIVRPESA